MTIKRDISYFIWFFFARFLPGHGRRSFLGKVRNRSAHLCLVNADPNCNIGQMVEFGHVKNISIRNNSGIGQYSIVKGDAEISIGCNVTMGPRIMILSNTHDFKKLTGYGKTVVKPNRSALAITVSSVLDLSSLPA